MSVKIRLTRIGRHKDPFYRIVAADSRFARDGRYIEQIGTFDPKAKENAAKIDEELALKWLNQGAQPSDSVRALFSEKGLIAKFAESKVKKGAKKPAKKAAAPKEEAKKPAAKKTAAKKTAAEGE